MAGRSVSSYIFITLLVLIMLISIPLMLREAKASLGGFQLVASSTDAYGLAGASTTIPITLAYDGASVTLKVYIPSGGAYIAIASGIFAKYMPPQKDWAIGYSTAKKVKNKDGVFCDYDVVVTRITKYHKEYERPSRIDAAMIFRVRGYIWKNGILCFDKKYPFSLDASSYASLPRG